MIFSAKEMLCEVVLDTQGSRRAPHSSKEVGLAPGIKFIKIKLTGALLSRKVVFLLF